VLALRHAQVWGSASADARDVAVAVDVEGAVDLEGRLLLPGLVNAHDHLDFSTFPPLGRPPYPSAYAWARDVDAGRGDPSVRAALAVPPADRVWLGGLRNLLAGVTAVAHHNPYHRSLARPDFPVRVLAKYEFAHSPGLTPSLKRTYRTTDRRIPWMVHAGEGVDGEARADLAAIREANCLRQNTVLVHGIAFDEADASAIAAARACVVWCPESNRRLYGATADVAHLRSAGVRLGLGSDSPVSGVRDALSNLAAARREGVFSDDELLSLATRGSAEVARLPCGGLDDGQPRDLLVANSPAGLLGGDRGAVVLVIVDGRPRYGRDAWMAALAPESMRCDVDGHPRRLEAGLARRLRRLLRDHPRLAELPWLAGVVLKDA
jgi:cytosine/adenosine deaminase-related metal-dependent hydrolase